MVILGALIEVLLRDLIEVVMLGFRIQTSHKCITEVINKIIL